MDPIVPQPQPQTAVFPAAPDRNVSGNRGGMDDETGLKNCAIGIKRILPIAERHNVTIVMELLNSRVNHKDYMCDRTPWGVALCQAIGSERFGLLYDIYHYCYYYTEF